MKSFFFLFVLIMITPSVFFSFRTVVLGSVAPESQAEAVDHFGVFAEGENVSSLLHPNSFLPTCSRLRGGQFRNLTLSKTNGEVWVERQNVPLYPARLEPLQPPRLVPRLSGVYQCRTPSTASNRHYKLEVVGKSKTQQSVECFPADHNA